MTSWDWAFLAALCFMGAAYPSGIWVQRVAENENEKVEQRLNRATMPGVAVLMLLILGLFSAYSCSSSEVEERHQIEMRELR